MYVHKSIKTFTHTYVYILLLLLRKMPFSKSQTVLFPYNYYVRTYVCVISLNLFRP